MLETEVQLEPAANPLDNPLVGVPVQDEQDPLAEYRKVAKRQPSKMSAARAAKLKAINEKTKADKLADELFAEQFQRLPKDTWTLKQVISGCSTDQQNLERRANKLRVSLRRGWQPGSVSDVLLMSALTREEEQMTDEQFVRTLEQDRPDAPRQTLKQPAKATSKKSAGSRPCKAGRLCLKFDKEPGQAAAGKQFCSENCRESFPIRKRQESRV